MVVTTSVLTTATWESRPRARCRCGRRTGAIIGEVSTGILESAISGQLLHELPTVLLYFAISLGIGLVASLTLARRLKRSTFGLELDEIASLVQEREAMLHNIREGVITLDTDERVTLINDEARRLLPIAEFALGRSIAELVEPGRLRDLLSGATAGEDQVVLTDEHVLVVNRMPVLRDGRQLGAVITLRDRTELEALLRELDGVDALTDALRAQQHEFSNRMHTLAGLIELGDHDAARQLRARRLQTQRRSGRVDPGADRTAGARRDAAGQDDHRRRARRRA